MFYVHTGIIYSVIMFGIVLCAIRLRKTIKDRIQLRIISFAILFPFVFNLLYILGITRRFIKSLGFRITFDVTPIAFTLTLFIFLYAIYRYDFLDMMPIYKEEIIRKVQTAIIVTDCDGVVIECNNEARDLLGFDDMLERETLKTYIDSIVSPEQKNILVGGAIGEEMAHKFEWHHDESVYEIHKKPYLDSKERIQGFIYAIYDVTYYDTLGRSIKDKQEAIIVSNKALEERIDMSKELSRIAARNYFARELHDILGHSMTVAIKLLEVSGISYPEDKTMAVSQLEEAARVSSKGYSDLRKSIVSNFEAEHDFVGLRSDIKKNRQNT